MKRGRKVRAELWEPGLLRPALPHFGPRPITPLFSGQAAFKELQEWDRYHLRHGPGSLIFPGGGHLQAFLI